MTDKQIIDALRRIDSRSKGKLLKEAADRIEKYYEFLESLQDGGRICRAMLDGSGKWMVVSFPCDMSKAETRCL